MNILLIGSGGREHALAWKLSQSPRCHYLFIAPGNPGTEQHGLNVPLDPLDFAAIKRFVSERDIGMIVVGPEAPLVAGIYDFFETDPVKVIGPSQQGAMLEGSKAFAKAFMMRHHVPTAAYREFTSATSAEARAHLQRHTLPIVLKADGLAAGKGVVICPSVTEADMVLQQMLAGKFGAAGDTVVVEEFLQGREVSVFALTDGRHYKLLASAKDYKRLGEGDSGPNTGGMGAISPVPFADEGIMRKVEQRIVAPMIHALNEEGITYKGVLYCGLMIVDQDPFVIEFNCRFGDPETQVVLPRLKTDLVELFECVAAGTLGNARIEIDDRACCTVVLAAGGYPEAYQKGKPITGLDKVSDAIVFQAGTAMNDHGQIVSSGGRVVAVSAFGDSLDMARRKALTEAGRIHFDGRYVRRDIGLDVLPA